MGVSEDLSVRGRNEAMQRARDDITFQIRAEVSSRVVDYQSTSGDFFESRSVAVTNVVLSRINIVAEGRATDNNYWVVLSVSRSVVDDEIHNAFIRESQAQMESWLRSLGW